VRWLLADEVGLGKTIVACLILSALVRTGRAKRALVIAPSTLAVQWLGELYRKFHQVFVLIDEARVESVERDYGEGNDVFDIHPFGVISMEYLASNPELMRQARSAELDLVVVDEAHRLALEHFDAAVAPMVRNAKHAILLSATPLAADRRGSSTRLELPTRRFVAFEEFDRAVAAGGVPVHERGAPDRPRRPAAVPRGSRRRGRARQGPEEGPAQRVARRARARVAQEEGEGARLRARPRPAREAQEAPRAGRPHAHRRLPRGAHASAARHRGRALPRDEPAAPDLHRGRRRGPQLPVLRPHGALRPARRPRRPRAAHRPARPHRGTWTSRWCTPAGGAAPDIARRTSGSICTSARRRPPRPGGSASESPSAPKRTRPLDVAALTAEVDAARASMPTCRAWCTATRRLAGGEAPAPAPPEL
jgi:hypothetical protein